MKRILFLCIIALLLSVSCATPFSGISYYSDKPLGSNRVYVSVDETSKTIEGGAYLIPAGYSMVAISNTETVKLGTIENKELIKSSLISKGYSISKAKESSDLTAVFESTTSPERSEVNIGFYLNDTDELVFLCKGIYGVGNTMQDDLDNALIEALKSIPSFSVQ